MKATGNKAHRTRRRLQPVVRFVECWHSPWILDTEDKVKWANVILRHKRITHAHKKWKLGDYCWYKPNAAHEPSANDKQGDQEYERRN